MNDQLSHNQNSLKYLALGVLKFFDLETKEKMFMALLEVIPTVGLWYAVFGQRIKVSQDRSLSLERISMMQRGLYLAGEVFVSGHILAGAYDSIRRRGAGAVRRYFWQFLVQRMRELSTRRAVEGTKRFAAHIDRP